MKKLLARPVNLISTRNLIALIIHRCCLHNSGTIDYHKQLIHKK